MLLFINTIMEDAEIPQNNEDEWQIAIEKLRQLGLFVPTSWLTTD